jgi:hypothetical protein
VIYVGSRGANDLKEPSGKLKAVIGEVEGWRFLVQVRKFRLYTKSKGPTHL